MKMYARARAAVCIVAASLGTGNIDSTSRLQLVISHSRGFHKFLVEVGVHCIFKQLVFKYIL